jgi:hypothetical protein
MVVQKMQGSSASYIGCPKNDIRAGCPTSSKNCSLNRDVECLSVGTIFAHSFSERSAMAAHLQLPRKMAPNPIDQHVGSRVRMRREMLAMSQHKLGVAPHNSNESASSTAQIDDFASDSDGLRLIGAFMRIDNAALRRRIVMLVQRNCR